MDFDLPDYPLPTTGNRRFRQKWKFLGPIVLLLLDFMCRGVPDRNSDFVLIRQKVFNVAVFCSSFERACSSGKSSSKTTCWMICPMHSVLLIRSRIANILMRFFYPVISVELT